MSIISKKAITNRGRNFFRKTLIVVQFGITISLIAGTLTIFNQIRFMKSHDLGVDIDKTLVLKPPGVLPVASQEERNALHNVLKSRIESIPGIQKVSVSSFVPGETLVSSQGVRRIGVPKEDEVESYTMMVSSDYFDFYGVELVSGRNFSEFFSPDNMQVILNETTVSLLGFESPESAVNEKFHAGQNQFEIIGVVRDYHQQSLKHDYEPLMLVNMSNYRCQIAMKYSTEDVAGLIASVREIWDDVVPGNPFEYFFLDEFYNRQYYSDIQFGRLVGFFTFIAILIGCLGLFGLSYYNVSIRVKEIGIRKTLGASLKDIVTLLTREMLVMVTVSAVVAMPLAYFYFSQWLNDYAFRIEIGSWFFFIPLLMITIISLLTTLSQVVKAVRLNPVESLRYE